MSSTQPPKRISLKSRIEQITTITIPSLFILTNLLTFRPSRSYYCDYILFTYTSFLLFFIIIKLTGLTFLNVLIKDKLVLIDSIKGKGVIILSISLLYISNGGLRTCMSILLLINGLYLLLIEWLWLSKDNLLCTPSSYNTHPTPNYTNAVERNTKSKTNPYDVGVGEDF
jgi:hypothetical protein